MKITLRRSGEGYYRVSSEGAPLLVELPCVVSGLESGRMVLEIANEEKSAQLYKRAFGVDRTLQLALATEEEKQGRHASLTALIQAPPSLPSGPCIGAAILEDTRCFRAVQGQGANGTNTKPVACPSSEVGPGAKCKVLLDVVGLKRKPESARWHFDVAVSQVLLEHAEPKKVCPFSDDAPLDIESCVHDEESEYVVPDAPETEARDKTETH